MWNILVRIGCFAAALLMIADVALPQNTDTLHVAAHREVDHMSTRTQSWTSNYTVDLIGAHAVSCKLDPGAYGALQAGDTVALRSSRVFSECTHIERDGAVVYHSKFWRLWSLIGAAFMLAVVFGVSQFNVVQELNPDD